MYFYTSELLQLLELRELLLCIRVYPRSSAVGFLVLFLRSCSPVSGNGFLAFVLG